MLSRKNSELSERTRLGTCPGQLSPQSTGKGARMPLMPPQDSVLKEEMMTD